MSKKIKSRVAAFLLSLQVFFSMVAPVQPFLNVVKAMEVSPASFELSEGALRAHGLSDGEYQYFFVDQTGVLQASVGVVADGQLDLTWLSQSGTDLIDLQPQRVVLKTAIATYHLELTTDQVNLVDTSASDALELIDADQDFLFDVWQIDMAARSAVTTTAVVVGQTYRFPLQPAVQVTFSRLPDDPSALTIQEIELSPEQQAELGTLSPLAYDITTEMDNGAFAFDLRLPLAEATDQELVVKYADSVEELAAAQVADNEIEVAAEAVVIKELEHMTVFVVTGAPVPVGAACQDAGASIGGTCFADLQSAINASVNGDTIELQTNLTTNSQITIANKTIVINGNGHTVAPTFTKTSNSNNAVFGINGVAATVTLNDLIIDGAAGTDLHGINVYVSNAVLNNVDIRNNQNTAININGSHVVVHNLSTSGNATKAIFGTFYSFNVIELAKGSGVSREPMLTITGQSQHSEIQGITNRRHINTKVGAVVDVNSQYSKSGSNYMLKSAPAAPANLVAIVTDNNVVASWNAVGYAHSYDYEITGVTTRTGNTTSLTATETSLPNGDYEIKVRSVAQSGLTGNWTNPVAFSINFNPHPDPENKYQMSVGGHLYRDFQMNDCFGKTSCENRAERLGAGWTMNLYEEAIDGEWILHSTTTSIADGSFKFPAVKEAGRYHLCQVTNAGWTQQVQNWSGTPYHIPTMNQSGNMTEGPYCRTIVFDDTKSYSNASYFGNVDMTKPITEVVSPASGAYYNGGVISLNLKSADFQSGIAKVVANIHQVGKSPTHLKTCVNSTLNPVQNEHEFVCQIDTALLADGAYFVKANALDLAGNMSNTISWDFIVDSTKPAAPTWLTSPFFTRLGDVNRTGTNQGGNIKFAASSSNDVVSYQYQFVRFNLNGSHAATGTNVIINPSVCSAGVCHWNNVTIEKDQMWIYRLRAIDHAGNKSSWTDWNDLTDAQFSNLKNQSVSYQDFMQKTGAFSVTNGYGDGTTGFTIREEVEPSSTITTPDPTAGTFVTANAALTIGYSAQDAHTAVAKVELYMSDDNGTNFTKVDDSSQVTGEFSYELAVDGEYCFHTRAVDVANMGAIDAGLGNLEPTKGCELMVVYDSTLPQSAITGPGRVDPNDQNTIIVSDWDGSVIGTATDAAPGQLLGVELEISRLIDATTTYWNGVAWSSDATSRVQASSSDGFANWNYAIDTDLSGPLTTGTYTVVSRAYDLAGNKENSATLTIVLDREIPEVNITVDPTNPDGQNNWYKTRPTITLTEGVSHSGIKVIQYSWNNSNGPWTNYVDQFQIPSEGSYVLYYRAINNADVISGVGVRNLRWDQTELTEGPLKVDATPDVSAGPNAKVVWEAATDNVGIARYKVTFDLLDGDADFAVEVGSEVRELSTDRLAEEGKWKITVTAYDGAGHSKSASDEIVVDKTAPAAPVLSLTGTGAGSVDLSWTAVADANDYIVLYGVEDGSYIYAARVGNTTSFTVEGLTAGNYYFVVRAEDQAGNQSGNSNQVSSLALAAAAGGGAAQAAGFAPAQEVLGVEDEEAAQAAAAQDNPDAAGQVQGVSTSCEPISNYWWVILILLQLAALLLAEYKLGRRYGKWKWLLYAAAVAAPVFALRQLVDSSCFSGGFLGFVHGYFYLLTAAMAGLARAAAYLLIDES